MKMRIDPRLFLKLSLVVSLTSNQTNMSKIIIEKQDAREVHDGNIFHDGVFTNDEGKEFSFTITEMRMNGSSTLDIAWCEEEPFIRETDEHPFTIEGSKEDGCRINILNDIIEQFSDVR